MRLGIVTLGQSPRPDIQADLAPTLCDMEIVQFGVLDDCSNGHLATFAPREGPFVLTQLRNGGPIKVGVPEVSQHLQNLVGHLEGDLQALLIFCARPLAVSSKRPVLRPSALLGSYLPSVMQRGHLTVIRGSPELLPEGQAYWSARLPACRISMLTASPFSVDWEEEWNELVENLHSLAPQAVLLDGLGYTRPMQQYLKKRWNGPILLPRALLGQVLSNIF